MYGNSSKPWFVISRPEGYYDYPPGSVRDPKSSSTGDVRVIRGGDDYYNESYRDSKRVAERAFRWATSNHRANYTAGFRIVLPE